MPSVCFYFQVHQPDRLRRYSVFDLARSADYFDEERNAAIVRKVADKCYLPTNALLKELIDRHDGAFRVSFSISGTALDQFERFAPEVLRSFQDLVATGCVELLAETYFHSLSFVFDREEFDAQVDLHAGRVRELFGVTPRVFRNTELIFSNALARHVMERGFAGVLAEGADRVLGWRSPNFLYRAATAPDLKVLLKNYRLSDDIAFRFGDRGWADFPLTVDRFTDWVNGVQGNGDVVNLFMDYETFGEHQWESTGIFEFLRALPGAVLARPDLEFRTPGEVVDAYGTAGEIDVHDFTSWADVDRDLTAWLGNPMQEAAARALYSLRPAALGSGDEDLIRTWRRLTTSDHLYYQCTKWFADGDVHAYFSPYESPYEAYIYFMNVLNDLARRLGATPSATGGPAEAFAAPVPGAVAAAVGPGQAPGPERGSPGALEALEAASYLTAGS